MNFISFPYKFFHFNLEVRKPLVRVGNGGEIFAPHNGARFVPDAYVKRKITATMPKLLLRLSEAQFR